MVFFIDTKKNVVDVPKPWSIHKKLNQWQVRMFRWPDMDPKRNGTFMHPRTLKIATGIPQIYIAVCLHDEKKMSCKERRVQQWN